MVELTYRDMRPDDFNDLHGIVSHWEVVRQLGRWPWPPELEYTKTRCKPYSGNGFIWAICFDDLLRGTVGVVRGDLGYNLAPAFHGQGVMSRSAKRAVSHAFDTTDLNILTASTWHDNAASYRVLRKLGFVHWSTRYQHAKARGFPTMIYDLRLTRADWDRLRSATD